MQSYYSHLTACHEGLFLLYYDTVTVLDIFIHEKLLFFLLFSTKHVHSYYHLFSQQLFLVDDDKTIKQTKKNFFEKLLKNFGNLSMSAAKC